MFIYPKTLRRDRHRGRSRRDRGGIQSARLGCPTLMLTQNLDSVGQMSCNPAIGGQAKGQMVREIDALGGVMGLNTTRQHSVSHAQPRKGPSVRSPRAQCDKKAYQFRAKAVLEADARISTSSRANAIRILVDGDEALRSRDDLGAARRGQAVVVTTGTFMRGLLHVGLQKPSRRTDGRLPFHVERQSARRSASKSAASRPARRAGCTVGPSTYQRMSGTAG